MLKNLNAIMETVKYKRGATDVSKNYEKLSETYYDYQPKNLIGHLMVFYLAFLSAISLKIWICLIKLRF